MEEIIQLKSPHPLIFQFWEEKLHLIWQMLEKLFRRRSFLLTFHRYNFVAKRWQNATNGWS